jgi:hypothetical protein
MAEHHVERIHVAHLRAPIEGALYDCISQHGPITDRWVPSAAKRVRGQLTRFLREREDTVRSLATERTQLRRHVAHLEDALRPFCRPDRPPTIDEVRHACWSLYGAQPWIDAFTPPWARASPRPD